MPHPDKPELAALTSLRGIAAILVMCHHFMFVVLTDVGSSAPSNLFIKSYLWVDLFFILSGFVLAYVYHQTFLAGVNGPSYRAFIQSRFARIYPLHFFMLLLFVAFESFQWGLGQLEVQRINNLPPPFTDDESADTILTNALLLQTFHWKAYWNQPAWSISAEWIIYFTLPFAMRWLLPLANRRPLLLFVSALIPLSVIEWHFGDLGLHFAGWPMLIRCFCEAGLGILAFRCYQDGLFERIASANLLTTVFLLNLFVLALPLPGVVSVAGFVWLVLCASRLNNNQNHFMNHAIPAYLGTLSYSIYMTHWFVMDVLRDCVAYFTGTSVTKVFSISEQFALMTGLIALVLCISHVTYHWLEAPMRKRLKPSTPAQRQPY